VRAGVGGRERLAEHVRHPREPPHDVLVLLAVAMTSWAPVLPLLCLVLGRQRDPRVHLVRRGVRLHEHQRSAIFTGQQLGQAPLRSRAPCITKQTSAMWRHIRRGRRRRRGRTRAAAPRRRRRRRRCARGDPAAGTRRRCPSAGVAARAPRTRATAADTPRCRPSPPPAGAPPPPRRC
jgi:hypothetical protein